MERLRWPRGGDEAKLLTAAMLFVLASSFLAVRSPALATGLLGVGAGAAIFAIRPSYITVLAVVGVVLVRRLPIGSTISVSDALLTVAAIAAFPALSQRLKSPLLSGLRAMLLVYMLSLSVTLLLHPSSTALLEWLHRGVLVGGALAVGAWAELEGMTRLALRLYVLASVLVALAACFYTVTHSFHSAYPLGFQKNYAGSLLSLAAVLVVAAPVDVGIGDRTRQLVVLVVLGLGLASTQSRAAMLSLVAGILVWFFRVRPEVRRRTFVAAVLLALTFSVIAINLLRNEEGKNANGLTVTSATIRNRVEAQTRRIWRTSPLDGVGIRFFVNPYWRAQNYYVQAPNNVIDEALAEGGYIEAVGFVIMEAGALYLLGRRRDPLSVAAMALVADRLCHGMFDIYWTAGNSAFPWMVAGMAAARNRADRRPASLALAIRPPKRRDPQPTLA